MKLKNKETFKQIVYLGDDFENLISLMDLPDTKFDQIYPELKKSMQNVFSEPSFQQEILRNLKIQSVPDIEAEKAFITEFIEELKQDDTLSSNKLDFITTIIMNSATKVYDLMEVPRERIEIEIEKINENAKLPEYAHPTDAGADIFASETVILEAGKTKIIPTGIKVNIPTGYTIFIYPRSGMSLKTGMRIANSVGVIDSDYNKEIGVIMTNTSNSQYTIHQGDKIAQMVIMPVPMIKFIEVNNIQDSGRGGFGSTGN